MSKVQLIVTIESNEQADKVLSVLNEAEVNGELDFALYVSRRDVKTSPHLDSVMEDTFSYSDDPLGIGEYYTVGDDGEPMI